MCEGSHLRAAAEVRALEAEGRYFIASSMQGQFEKTSITPVLLSITKDYHTRFANHDFH